MKIVYLILVHKTPPQLLRLINALNDSEVVFVIHVDKQVTASPFKAEAKKSCAKLHFINKRHEARWGSFGLVQATLNGLKFIQRRYNNAERIILLSGEDYPIKPVRHIKSYLADHRDTIFMNFFSIPYSKWKQSGISRFPLYDEVSKMIDIYAGSQWLSFPVYIIDVIFEFLRLNESFLEYYKQGVSVPDESFFQTLFLNCGAVEITENIVNHNLHLIKWDRPYMHPRILTMADKNIIDKSKSLFARKFDAIISAEVLDYIDKKIGDIEPLLIKDQHISFSSRPLSSAIVLLTNKMNETIYNKYRLLNEAGANCEVFVLLHQQNDSCLPTRHSGDMQIRPFTDEILKTAGYSPIGNTLVPGSNHFPLFQFYRDNPRFDYYWYIEDDVYLNSSWKDFFAFFPSNQITSDFISSHIQDFSEIPKWYWWNTLKHPSKIIAFQDRVRSFNPIYRMSNSALKYLHHNLIDGWQGHHEVLIPTLLKYYGFSISDLGGTGQYVSSQCRNKFYKSTSEDGVGLLNSGSFRFRPFIKREEITDAFLYHPYKDDAAKDWQLSYDERR